jgi:MFS family permease
MHITPHINLHRLFKTKKELKEIYLNQIIQRFALTLIGIFIPIYLITIGFSVAVSLFFMLTYFVFEGITAPLCASISSRVGLKHIILYRTPALILFYALLILVNPQISGLGMGMLEALLIPVSAIGGFSQGLYWISINSEFVKNSDKIHVGEEVSHLIAFPRIAAIVAPFIAAVLLKSAGFDLLFILVIVLLLVSVFPLFMSKDYKGFFGFKFSQFRLLLSRHLTARFLSEGFMHITEAVIWPLYIFLMYQDIVLVGIAASLSGLGIAAFTLIIGKISDRVDRLKMLRIGGLTYGIISFMRFFSTNISEVFLLSFLGGVFFTLVSINLFANFCDYTKGKNILGSVSFREFWLAVGRILLLFIAILMFPSMETVFIITGVLALIHVVY